MTESQYRGIEKVDPQELASQRALTEALWVKLEEQGWRAGRVARIECYFLAPSADAASRLGAAFSSAWEPAAAVTDDGQNLVRLKTETVCVTRKALLDLVEVLMIAAQESSCTFDGFQLETTGLERKRPWWKLW